MPVSTSTTPYYDDFDKTKGYYRILFRPGYAVQARELTQLQTSLQNQIGSFGTWAFPDGKKVTGGELATDARVHYVKLYDHIGTNDDLTTATANVGLVYDATTANGHLMRLASEPAEDLSLIHI